MENYISKKRVFGSAVLGLIVIGYLMNAFDYTVPMIISYINHTSVAEAVDVYDSLPFLHLMIATLYIFIGSGTGAYISRKKGLLVAFLSSVLFIIGLSYLLINSIIIGDTSIITAGVSYQLFTFIYLILVISASLLGGYYGQKLYSVEDDLDIGNDKLTFFGIRWAHYFWILPAIIYPFFSSFLIILYSYIILFLSYLYIAIHPSLWWNLFSIMYIVIIPAMIYFSSYATLYAFIRFFELMRYKQNKEFGWRRIGKILGFGVAIPAIFFTVSAFAVSYIHNLPTPKAGDWKIAIYLALGIYTIFGLFSFYEWAKETFRSKNV